MLCQCPDLSSGYLQFDEHTYNYCSLLPGFGLHCSRMSINCCMSARSKFTNPKFETLIKCDDDGTSRGISSVITELLYLK